MDVELEDKKKEDEEKAKEMELNATKEADKLGDVVKEIAVEANKQLRDSATKNQNDGVARKHPETFESGKSK